MLIYIISTAFWQEEFFKRHSALVFSLHYKFHKSYGNHYRLYDDLLRQPYNTLQHNPVCDFLSDSICETLYKYQQSHCETLCCST